MNSVRSDTARETVFLDLRGNDKNRAEERSKSEAVKRILHITRGRSQATELVLFWNLLPVAYQPTRGGGGWVDVDSELIKLFYLSENCFSFEVAICVSKIQLAISALYCCEGEKLVALRLVLFCNLWKINEV